MNPRPEPPFQGGCIGGYFTGSVVGIILSIGIAVVIIAMAMYVALGASG